MRRWIAVFLAAFVPPTAVMVFFAWRAQAPRAGGDDRPLVSVARAGLPQKGTARGVAIRVYEDDDLVAEIAGSEAEFEGRERAVFRDAVIRAWPEKGRHERAPEEVLVRAGRAEIDRNGFVARVVGNVVIETPEGDTLRAEDLKILFGKRIRDAEGKEIVDHSEKTVDTDGPVELTVGDSRLRGTGFHGNLGLKAFRLERDIRGELVGTQADFSPTATHRAGQKPEDVTFRAGGPVTGDPLPAEGRARRTRLVMNGGVSMMRIDPDTEKPTTLACDTLTAEVLREKPPLPPSLAAWEAAQGVGRAMGLQPTPPPELAGAKPPPARLHLERLLLEGHVVIVDPRIGVEADLVETTNARDGSGATAVRGPKKRIVFHEKGALELGPMGAKKEGAGRGGPVEVTAMDDVRIVRAADGSDGARGAVTIGLSRWVWVREGARELTCDALRLDLASAPQEGKDGALGYAARGVEASGNVLLKETGRTARADTIRWTAESDTVTLHSDAGAEVSDPKSRLAAKTIAFDNRTGRIRCEGNVVAEGEGGSLAPSSLVEIGGGSRPAATRWKLTCPSFTGEMAESELRSLDAAGPVQITTDNSTATAAALHYAGGQAVLTGSPARVVTGEDFVEASEIALSPDTGRAVLHGVRRIRLHLKGGMSGLAGLAPARPAGDAAAPTPVTLACSGPVVIDRNAGLFVARDRVLVRSPETAAEPGKPAPPDARLEAERLWLHFEPQTRELLGARATGRVLLRTSSLFAAGDRLTYDVATGTAAFTGIGKPLFKSGKGVFANVDEVVIRDGGRTLEFPARHSKGSISFPSGGPGERRPDDFLRNPFGDLKPRR